MRFVPLLALLLMAAQLSAAAFSHDVTVAAELRVRDGLPNVFAKLQKGRPVRIGYLGGSITAADGWRLKTLAWFRSQWPAATIIEINAAISGTGSDYGACRLQDDVLAHDPDLVLLECRVNGGAGYEAKSVEGIVRQVWQHNPNTDICFVYTISQSMLQDLQVGKNTPFGSIMEAIANAYGIPSIDLGVEVARREKEGSLIFTSLEPSAHKLVFSKDGTHPNDAGHDLYRDVIARCLLKMQHPTALAVRPHTLLTPLEPNCWQVACLLPITRCQLSSGWMPVEPANDPVYTDDKGRTDAMLRGAVKCSQTGQTITVRWIGTTFGLSDIPYAGGSVIEAMVDGGPPITIQRLQIDKTRKYARFWYLPEQRPGLHIAILTVRQVPANGFFYAGQILIVGQPR